MIDKIRYSWIYRHKMILIVLCLFILSAYPQDKIASGGNVNPVGQSPNNGQPERNFVQGKVYLLSADSLMYNESVSADYQVLKGDVRFRRDSMYMFCDSAYYYEKTNSFDAFSNVRMEQGDTLFVYGDVLYYDGNTGIARLRNNVRMENKTVTLTTDSLNYDQRKNIGYYFEGGKIVDTRNELTSAYGQYSPTTKKSVFQYDVELVNPDYTLYSDTLEYNTATKIADILGPSTIVSDSNIIYSSLGWYNTETEHSMLLDRSRVVSKTQDLTGDTIYYDRNTGFGEVFGNMVMTDTLRKIMMEGQYGYYNEKTEFAFATDSAQVIDFSGIDTLYLHADTIMSYIHKDIPADSIHVDSLLLGTENERFIPEPQQNKIISDSVYFIPLDSVYASTLDSLERISPAQRLRLFIPLDGLSKSIYPPVDSLLQDMSRRLKIAFPPPPPPLTALDSLMLTIRDTTVALRADSLIARYPKAVWAQLPDSEWKNLSAQLSSPKLDSLRLSLPVRIEDESLRNDSLTTDLKPHSIDSVAMVADSTTRIIKAYYGVRFYRGTSQGVCDSMMYVARDSVLNMYKDPVLWNLDYQIFGDTIKIYMNDSTINWAHIPKFAFAAEKKDSLFFNQLTGKDMKAFFDQGDLRRIEVKGNVETIFFPQEEDSTFIGLNAASSSYLNMYLKEKTLEKIVMWNKVTGKLTPVEQISPDILFLPDYMWFEYRRPKNRWDIFKKVPRKAEDVSTRRARFVDDPEEEE